MAKEKRSTWSHKMDHTLVSKEVHELEYYQKFYCIPGVSLKQLRAVHDTVQGAVTHKEFKVALDAAGLIHHDPVQPETPTDDTANA
jgi:hypothetical protein